MTAAEGWPIFMAKLKTREEVAERTMAFFFERPQNWTFKAGQFIDITIIDPPQTDAKGNTRGFSIASAPHDPHIMVTTRLRDSAFKRVLHSMPLGAEAKFEGPFGNLTLHNNAARPAVFLAGGIGITPFRSIAVRAATERLPHRIVLFYSNRRPEDAPFLDELRALERDNSNFHCIPTMTQMAHSKHSWSGETGRIDKQMLGRHLDGVRDAIYYIAGPPAMVSGLHAMLNSAGINDDDIRIEEFAGY
ncbi:MAG: oxidoreductase [Candidatus Methylomirabilota bacterium]|nr:FAD-dependent oxidoreductase [Candidatus Methylomirabilis sp.]NJD68142.1 FAD-dependent oxidoreductase [candidate division NC10 bacterium]PWB46316.1 MAG: oxidoreductase [candidate division NC10 bacterium]